MNFVVESDRLFIRSFKPADAEEYYQMTRDPLVRKYVPFACEETLEETYSTIDKYYSHGDCIHDFYLVLEEKKSHKLVGVIIATALTSIPLTLEVAILTAPNFRRNGFMFEALTAFTNAIPKSTTLAFIVDKTNVASKNTVRKLPGIVESPFASELAKDVDRFLLTT